MIFNTSNFTNHSTSVEATGRLIGHVNRQQMRQRQRSMLMRSIQSIESSQV
ncbi:MAG: hypothetical protein F6K19_38975 [Cyanothece sp. SIO1E1]|nr:hypothetical protein [Cyanothece sp. SIO1E1]